jgi:hypothetical protein
MCGYYNPSFPSTPNLFYKLRVFTKGLSTELSYCAYEKEIIVRVYGLPVGFVYALSIFSYSFIGLLSLAAVFVIIAGIQQVRRNRLTGVYTSISEMQRFGGKGFKKE